MKEKKIPLVLSVALLPLLGLGLWVSCLEGGSVPSPPQTHTDAAPHAANLQPFGQYHAEARTDKAGNVQLHVYGLQAGELMPLPDDAVLEAAMLVPGADAQTITFRPRPYPGEPQGQTSRWVGKWTPADAGLTAGDMAGMSVTLRHDGHTYRVQWSPMDLIVGTVADAHVDAAMPQTVGDSEAARLFQTPGGIYTASDILANGNTTAALKYQGQMARHNMNPKPGDKVCPITNTAADKRFAWIIGGKTYHFCCPPCIEEFVKRAKEQPDTIRDPDTYIKN